MEEEEHEAKRLTFKRRGLMNVNPKVCVCVYIYIIMVWTIPPKTGAVQFMPRATRTARFVQIRTKHETLGDINRVCLHAAMAQATMHIMKI